MRAAGFILAACLALYCNSNLLPIVGLAVVAGWLIRGD